MNELDLVVKKAPLPWLAGGLLLAIVQVAAVAANGPLGVSTQFVVADTHIIKLFDAKLAADHPVIGDVKYHGFGFGWWLVIGLIVGAYLAALLSGRLKSESTSVWWRQNRGNSVVFRFVACLIGGVFILYGSRLAHGCTSGQLASGWAQLSASVVPFTLSLFICGMITACIFHRKSPRIEK
jgi:uncharacterized membrane protein YedE/YeeE